MTERRTVRRRGRAIWGTAVLASVIAVVGCTSGSGLSAPPAPPATRATPPVEVRAEPLVAPTVLGTRLRPLGESWRPPAPMQWGGADGAIPFGRWWSGLEVGPGIPALWGQPLLLRMGETGRADLSAPIRTTRSDGFRDSIVEPAVFFEFGSDAAVRVIDDGPLHVRFTVSTSDIQVTITMIQGSPFLEIEGTGRLSLTVPQLRGLSASGVAPTVDRFSTAVGPWLFASSGPTDRSVEGDRVVIELADGVRHVIGPVPEGAEDGYDEAAMHVASTSLEDTEEVLTVGADGGVRQVLRQRRSAAGAVAWSLLPHHEEHLAGQSERAGLLPSVRGTSTIVTASSLTLDYPAVPVLWDAVGVPGFDPGDVDRDDVPPIGASSYFGARHTAATALVHDVLRAAGEEGEAAPYLDAAADSLERLMSSSTEPRLTWDPVWGSIVVSPAEFGSGTELNDHQLQNGYWVGAAASVVVADPSRRAAIEQGIDLLIADYAGASTVPHLAGTVSNEGTWSAFEGHSWASGVGGFASGNNLESISESSYAWWAAAKWFLATNRPELADDFIARLTIESWLTGDEWLPTSGNEPGARPWTGVVWAGKTDPGTWFDASDEAALGIRLLPIGPQSFSRYHDDDTVSAAGARWRWCDAHGDGCVERWWNLLDTDAAVAGRPSLPEGDLVEEGTTELVRRWWRMHWDGSGIAERWTCTPGSIMRRSDDGSLVALVSNPGPTASTVRCADDAGGSFDAIVDPRSSGLVPLSS